MDGDPSQARRTALDLVMPLVRSQTVILTGSAARSERMARFMADAGARTVSIELGTGEADTRDRFAGQEHSLAEPDDTLRARLDTEDPEGRALVYAGSFTAVKDVCGRRVIGGRSAIHLDAERKDRQRELLGLGGEVVRLADGFAHLNPPVVVQGIPDRGVAMATSHTYLVPRSASDNRIAELAARLRLDCTHIVASEFNVGVPCTFYGFITATTVVDFGPVEALVYWDPHTWRIHAPGILRPLPMADTLLGSARRDVHAIARRLHQRLGYVGAFGTDGIIADDHYTIHEINPRICGGFSLLDQLVPTAAPLAAIDLVLRESPDASAALTSPLAVLAAVLERHPTPAYRLWENPPCQDLVRQDFD